MNICGLTGLCPKGPVSPEAPASSSLLPPSARCSATDEEHQNNRLTHRVILQQAHSSVHHLLCLILKIKHVRHKE